MISGRVPPRRLLALVLVVALAVLAGCGGSDGSGDGSSDGAKKPYVRPTGSPFSVTITGPDVASPGDVVTATLTNTGRLPDAYLLQSDPVGAVGIAQPNISLAPGEKTEVSIQVLTVPVLVRVQSISGGSGNTTAELSIGEQQ